MHMAGPENAARCARGSTGTWFREPIRRPISALKGSWSKYYRNYDGDIAANAYGRAGERSEMRTWLDRNLVSGTNTPTGSAATVLCPGVRVLPTDCDGIAQDNEIGISPSGGLFANPDRP